MADAANGSVAPARPLPETDVVTAPFWEAAKRHELSLQRCRAGDHRFMYPRIFCPVCYSDDLEWAPVSGKGRVYTFTVVHQAGHPFFQAQVPYVFAVVQLDEGPRMYTNIVEIDPDDVQVDMRVEAVFDDVTDDVTLVKFRPAS